MVWTFASRYFIARKSTQAINIISWVTVSAIAVGAAALIIVLSVFNGFQELVQSLYSSFYPQLKISPAQGKTMLMTDAQLRAVRTLPGLAGLCGILQEKALLRYGEGRTIAVLMGVDRGFSLVTGVKGRLDQGVFGLGTPDTPECVVGAGIQDNLGINIHKGIYPLTAYVPRRDAPETASPGDALNAGNLIPSGVFAIQQDFDNTYVITNIGFVRRLAGLSPGALSSIYLSIRDPSAMDASAARLRVLMGKNFLVQTRFQQNQTLYQVMQTEKWVVFAILSFIMAIAAFNLIGSLYMLVIDKATDISILRAMGATGGLIRRIFLVEGVLIALVGALIGGTIALVVCWLQQKFGIVGLQGNSFIIDSYPVSMHLQDFLLVLAIIILIALVASLYPAGRASAQQINLKGP